ncbi:phospholipase D-like domain-containing protein [Aestuariirhabdus sp. LZHN29]|uniref:phospholipase D-like domain-containing protein n=1 Tax=Aestuariirhabdus sp. LZHN29 TaxID=3417462 RepID=UPI003CF6A196
MIETDQLDQWLRDSLSDYRIDPREKQELRLLLGQIDSEQRHFLRNRAFDLAQEELRHHPEQAKRLLDWLRAVMRILDNSQSLAGMESSVYFSPGDDCREKLVAMIRGARQNLDICVFTISDDRISEAIMAAHRRGVAVRIISDDDKAHDRGSDIDRFRSKGVPLRLDSDASHMHNKFAIVDRSVLANGSFNWTRSASDRNQENILVTEDPALVRPFLSRFELLWSQYRSPSQQREEQIRNATRGAGNADTKG